MVLAQFNIVSILLALLIVFGYLRTCPILTAQASGDLDSTACSLPKRHRYPVTRRQRSFFLSGVILGAILTASPLNALAAHDDVTVYLLDNVTLTLVATPLVLLGLPKAWIARVTRPFVIDRVTSFLTRPIPATIVFSGTFFLSMLTPIVQDQAESALVRSGLQVVLIAAGMTMWLTALRLLPGVRQLSMVGRIVFLFAQSLLPTAPTFILIFAQHPLYPVFIHHAHIFGLSAVGDQELAGALAKILSLFILWGTAIILILRVSSDEERGHDPEPILWSDVEREFDRIEKRTPKSD